MIVSPKGITCGLLAFMPITKGDGGRGIFPGIPPRTVSLSRPQNKYLLLLPAYIPLAAESQTKVKTSLFQGRVQQGIYFWIPGYQLWSFRSCSGRHPGTPVLYTLLLGKAPEYPRGIYPTTRIGTQVPPESKPYYSGRFSSTLRVYTLLVG